MTSQPGLQTIALHILLNMSSKDNQAMKFGQLIEYNMRNIFEKNTQNVVAKLFPADHTGGSIDQNLFLLHV